MPERTERAQVVRRLVNRWPRLHLYIAIAGNAAFLIGSVLFLSSSTRSVGTWLFIVGQVGMLVGNVGQLAVRHESG